MNNSQQQVRDALSELMVKNPMSWKDLEKATGVHRVTLQKFAGGGDLSRIKCILQILKFIKEHENE